MDKRWLDLRWPVTVLLLGAMGFVLLARSSRHPIQLRLEVSFSKPVTVGGTLQHDLVMEQPVLVRMREAMPVVLRMTHPKPLNVEVGQKKPMEVQVEQQKPMEVQVEEQKPMEVQVQPEGAVKVRLGL